MKNYYYADAENHTCGPMSSEDLARLNRIGVIRPDTLVIEEGSDSWIPYSNLNSDSIAEMETPALPSTVSTSGSAVSPATTLPRSDSIVPSRNPAPSTGSVAYDPATIQTFADNLYRQANWAVALWVIGGCVVSLVVTVFTFGMGLLIAPFIILIAVFTGQSRALALRTAAQTLLCQVRIEENTRTLR